jgi:large subunit ribosomal protein L5
MADEKVTRQGKAGGKAEAEVPREKAPREKPAKGKPAKEAAPAQKPKRTPKEKVTPRLLEAYRREVVPALIKEFSYKNVMQVPRLRKIVLNMGLGEATQNVKVIDSAVAELTAIAGQKPVVTRARKSISTFKLRAGHPIGVMVTLRRERMWEFLDRFMSLAIPRTRDFKGVSPRGFDGKGNFTAGVREQIIFPEIDYDKIDKVKGFNVTICTSARTDKEGRALLARLGFPFRTEGGR